MATIVDILTPYKDTHKLLYCTNLYTTNLILACLNKQILTVLAVTTTAT